MSAGSHFNTELAKCRINAKMTLAQVSELTGIKQSTLQNWERGRNKSIHVAVDKVMLLAELYDVSYSDIENMVQAAYQTAKKEGYTNIGKKKYKKTEVTIKARNMIFRAEDRADEFYDGIDNVVSKLSSQMSRFKGKLQKKHKDNKVIDLAQVPEPEETEEIAVTRNKKFELTPMTVDEAVLQMEMLEHNFYVFLNVETDSVNVVYKRNEKDYGLLETTY